MRTNALPQSFVRESPRLVNIYFPPLPLSLSLSLSLSLFLSPHGRFARVPAGGFGHDWGLGAAAARGSTGKAAAAAAASGPFFVGPDGASRMQHLVLEYGPLWQVRVSERACV